MKSCLWEECSLTCSWCPFHGPPPSSCDLADLPDRPLSCQGHRVWSLTPHLFLSKGCVSEGISWDSHIHTGTHTRPFVWGRLGFSWERLIHHLTWARRCDRKSPPSGSGHGPPARLSCEPQPWPFCHHTGSTGWVGAAAVQPTLWLHPVTQHLQKQGTSCSLPYNARRPKIHHSQGPL